MSAFHRLMTSELVSSADHVAGRRYIASAGVRWCGAGGVRKDVYLSDTHINYAKTITGTAPGVPGRSCALPASRGARLARNIALPCVPVLSPSFLPFYLTCFLAFRTPSFSPPTMPAPSTSKPLYTPRPPPGIRRKLWEWS